MKLITKTDVTTESVLAPAVREWLALDSTSQDTMLATMAKAARMKIERLTGKAIGARTLVYTIQMPTYGVLDLPYPPVVSISTVKTIAEDGTTDTLVASDFSLVNESLYCASAIGFAVEVEYITGLTPTVSENQLIMKQTAWDYTHSGDTETATYSPDVLMEISQISVNNGF